MYIFHWIDLTNLAFQVLHHTQRQVAVCHPLWHLPTSDGEHRQFYFVDCDGLYNCQTAGRSEQITNMLLCTLLTKKTHGSIRKKFHCSIVQPNVRCATVGFRIPLLVYKQLLEPCTLTAPGKSPQRTWTFLFFKTKRQISGWNSQFHRLASVLMLGLVVSIKMKNVNIYLYVN